MDTGDPIELSPRNEVRVNGTSYGLPALEVVIEQGAKEPVPAFCLSSEFARANSTSRDRGMDFEMTREEARRLRDELTRWIDATDEAAK